MEMNDDYPVPIEDLDPELRVRCACTDATLLNWLARYVTADGRPIGAKVGGKWRVWPGRLEQFLQGGARKKYGRG